MFDIGLLLTKKGHINSSAVERFKDNTEFQQLVERYFWCRSTKEMVYCVRQQIVAPPSCKSCGQLPKFYNGAYKTYCSYKCSNKALAPVRHQKSKQTNVERYGVDNPMRLPHIQKKLEGVMLDKYGVRNPLQSPAIKQKVRQTNLEKYGAVTYLNTDEGLAKRKTTCLEKYGTEHYMQSQESRNAFAPIRLAATTRALNDPDNVALFSNIQQCLQNNKHLTLKQLAEQLGITRSRLRYVMQKFNIVDPNSFWRHKSYYYLPEYRDFFVKKYHEELKTHDEIGQELQMSAAAVQRICIHHKIKARIQCNQSSQEREIGNFLTDIGIANIITNTRELIDFELDIYLPDHQLAIEYNGDFWHTVDHESVYSRHRQKYQQCWSKNIKLLQIRGSDWARKQDIWKSMIKINCGIVDETVYARNCEVRVVNRQDTESFLIHNHLQGSCASKTNLGLYYNDNLVMLQTFGKSRFKKGTNELLRMCSKLNTKIVGGASKLFKHYVINYQPDAVQTFADLEYSTGQIYEKLGFVLSHETPSNYHYFDGEKYINRMNFQKKKFNIPDDITEKRFFLDLGYRIYWDAGQKSFVWKNPNK